MPLVESELSASCNRGTHIGHCMQINKLFGRATSTPLFRR